jgi:predicted dehydrogenase
MSDQLDRRDFLKKSAVVGAGLAFGASGGCAARPRAASRGPAAAAAQAFAAPPMETVRIGFVGVGHQGTGHLRNLLNIPGAEIRAIADISPSNMARALTMVAEAGHSRPEAYDRGPEDFRRLCERDDIDLIYTATPWEWHAPVLLAAMRNGKHGATEIPLAITVDECWELVETAEQTKRHCVMMENVCYGRTEMAILHMVRNGLLGELIHAESGYLHDLRRHKLTDFYVGRWRVRHSIERDGDLYPMHGIGPLAWWLDINRGNQFDYLVSTSTKSRGLNLWAEENLGPDSPEAGQQYALGDVVNTLIKTTNDQSILLTHDTNLPRPYSRRTKLQGTRGLVGMYPDGRIHVEGRSEAHQWEDLTEYTARYDHPIWKDLGERARGAGHGGMDYIEDYRLVQGLRTGIPLDFDVYDGAAWSAISELSERSIRNRSSAIDFPDFTRGAWRSRPPLDLGEEQIAWA